MKSSHCAGSAATSDTETLRGSIRAVPGVVADDAGHGHQAQARAQCSGGLIRQPAAAQQARGRQLCRRARDHQPAARRFSARCWDRVGGVGGPDCGSERIAVLRLPAARDNGSGMGDQPRVVAVSGHMIDAPDRARPRFPPDQIPRVAAEVRAALEDWNIGAGTTVVSGGARGADMIVSEEALERGARVLLCLALPPREFEERSVALPNTDWAARFRGLLGRADVEVQESTADSEDIFVRTNARIVQVARELGSGRPRAIVVWDGREGDHPGGTRDFVQQLGYDGPDDGVRVIDPTRRAYEARQTAVGPKKLLALDGGGIRGVLSVEILAALESKLRERHGRSLVLSDYFDYIGGTSTGAIIAAALALGKPVAEIRERYETLAHKVFRPRFLPLRLRSIYRDGPLAEELESFFGSDRTLGDREFRSLLLVVLHNTVTDSPWPLSNCTRATYNRPERNLRVPSDRNLDLPLSKLIRGSAAAPVFFPPQQLRVGDEDFVFEDGGVTAFNSPPLLMFLMATLPEYGMGWAVGEKELLLVSVGTGSSAAVHAGLRTRSVHLGFHARNLAGVFMNSAATSQDILCRSLGRTRAGDAIDLEFGARHDVKGVGGRNLFTYLRYNADLSAPALAAQGITERRRQERLRKLHAVDSIETLQELGRRVGATIDVDTHFADFL